MRKFIMKYGKIITGIALFVTTLSVNVACPFLGYQPELPEKAKDLRKF